MATILQGRTTVSPCLVLVLESDYSDRKSTPGFRAATSPRTHKYSRLAMAVFSRGPDHVFHWSLGMLPDGYVSRLMLKASALILR